MIRMHSAPSTASSPAEKWPNEEKAETRAPGAGNEKAQNRRPGLSAFLSDRARRNGRPVGCPTRQAPVGSCRTGKARARNAWQYPRRARPNSVRFRDGLVSTLQRRTGRLGRQDSNLCISESEFVQTLSSGREKSNMHISHRGRHRMRNSDHVPPGVPAPPRPSKYALEAIDHEARRLREVEAADPLGNPRQATEPDCLGG
jgi:hypothetical protein